MSRNLRALSGRHRSGRTLFEALTEAAAESGTVSDEQLKVLSHEWRISTASLLGAASFYDFLRRENESKRAYLCTSTACRLSGRQAESRGKLKNVPVKEIGRTTCVGHCYRGGGYRLGEATFDAGDGGSIPFASHAAKTVFPASPADPENVYQDALRAPQAIVEALAASGLRGRGGAGFPFASKLRFCVSAEGKQKYVVCNGDEGDPGAFSDRFLMEERPHLVLAGMLAAATAMGADTGYVYIRGEYPEAVKRMHAAVTAFEKTLAAQQSRFQFHVIEGAGAYICGEETALLNSIEGLRPEVRTRPPYPANEGLYGKPTLVSNVETFAAVPLILANGGDAFMKLGTEKSSGTKLVCLDAHFKVPGVHEVEMGTPMDTLVNDYGGGFATDIKALQVGGPLGSVVPVTRLATLKLDFESFAASGFLLGHAGIIAVPRDYPMLSLMRHLFEYMADESCGKCFPCRLGTIRGAQLLKGATQSPIQRTTFEDLLEALELGSLCGLGGGLPGPVRNILVHFADELSAYFRD
jgi:NADH-quinone oxidoreductase subunit F